MRNDSIINIQRQTGINRATCITMVVFYIGLAPARDIKAINATGSVK